MLCMPSIARRVRFVNNVTAPEESPASLQGQGPSQATQQETGKDIKTATPKSALKHSAETHLPTVHEEPFQPETTETSLKSTQPGPVTPTETALQPEKPLTSAPTASKVEGPPPAITHEDALPTRNHRHEPQTAQFAASRGSTHLASSRPVVAPQHQRSTVPFREVLKSTLLGGVVGLVLGIALVTTLFPPTTLLTLAAIVIPTIAGALMAGAGTYYCASRTRSTLFGDSPDSEEEAALLDSHTLASSGTY